MLVRRVGLWNSSALYIAYAVVFVVATAGSSWADEGRCLIAVDRHVFLKGRCNIEVQAGGSFTVGVSDKERSEYFAYVNLDAVSRTARGYWNGVEGESHADTDLGSLKRKGGCWSNKRAKICAWRLP
jgi:hypothetical protein